MNFIKINNKTTKEFKLKNQNSIILSNRDSCAIHNDTDSVYFSINEIKKRLIESTVNIKTEDEYRDFYQKMENIFQTFFNKILEIRAQKSKTINKIKFNRENIFKNMFCFAKKLYIGNIIDSEGHKYPFDKPKHKIMGVGIKKSTMPNFCKIAAEKLAFDICNGITKEEADKTIKAVYKQYCESSIDEISAVIGISNYKKYIPQPIDYYVKNGLEFDKGDNASVIFGAKAALTYNYVVAKKRLKLNPINNNTKMKYIYVLPNNEFKYKEVGKSGLNPVNFVAFLDSWPKEFDSLFTIDYETMFRKSFCALFESMYIISKWMRKGEELILEDSALDEFFY